MNNLYKTLAFLLLVFVTSSINAQNIRPATVTADGLIILDASTPDVAAEYVADISKFAFGNLLQAQSYFQKYLDKTSTRGIQYSFDLANQKLYIIVDVPGQTLIPLGFTPISVNNFNEVLRMVHLGLI